MQTFDTTDANFAAARRQMVAGQLAVSHRGITDRRVLHAMASVPRHEFVPVAELCRAYADGPLPIGYGQTMSQPCIVALMTQELTLQAADRVLEIGTGSGYQAAVLAQLVKHVYTIEIVAALAARAARDLRRLGYSNVSVRAGDGYKGWPEQPPFDAIIVTCAPEHIPQPLVEQLKEGGRMVIPVGRPMHQELYVLEKCDGEIHQRELLAVRFVPMTGQRPAD
ncbi:MAG: protein-L-isoaspartate(D-aspartate) O-methyltransferase [Verrucomicrobia bacterium]|nr:MAG: protein-L-isoaspartate(D-aspartate) O-methyltransferase [Verrucomicrobiota bacterium]